MKFRDNNEEMASRRRSNESSLYFVRIQNEMDLSFICHRPTPIRVSSSDWPCSISIWGEWWIASRKLVYSARRLAPARPRPDHYCWHLGSRRPTTEATSACISFVSFAFESARSRTLFPPTLSHSHHLNSLFQPVDLFFC